LKRILWIAVVVSLIIFGSASTASASAWLALVSGGSTLNVQDNGAVSCVGSCGGVPATDQDLNTGGISLSGFTFNGWTITITAGGSNSPSCSGTNGPGCLNQTNINATSGGSGTLNVYFADTGFTPSPAILMVANASAQQTGAMETQQAYAFNGPLPAGLTTQPANGTLAFVPAGGACGAALSSTPPGVTASPTSCAAPSSTPYDLELATTFTATAAGQGFSVNGNIVADPVPEPGNVVLFATALLAAAVVFRRKLGTRRS
jgi:hypothetical protein